MSDFLTITFEDNGQDFLEWVVKDGVVIDCQPFQGRFWIGTKVEIENISPVYREIKFKSQHNHRFWPLKHRVQSIQPSHSDYVAGFEHHLTGRWDEEGRSKWYQAGWNVAKYCVEKGIAHYQRNIGNNELCSKCDGIGSIDYPNISGHDYSESCSHCKGSGVAADD